MKTHYFVLPLAMVALLLMGTPESASAHETHIYKIGHQAYQFTVGSLNEPIAVDDNTGVDLLVIKAPVPGEHEEEEKDHHETAGAVEGLDKTLKVEISAGDKKKVLELRPKHGEPGRYTAKFYPTLQTTYTYRFFGDIKGTPIDLSFTCNPAGHPQVEEDKTQVKISDKITRLHKKGAFGCPTAKADLGFPEPAASEYELAQKMESLAQKMESSVAGARNEAGSARSVGIIGIVAGILGLIAGVGAWIKGRKV